MPGYSSKKIWVIAIGILILLSAYLWALSTISFRLWMAEWNLGRNAYPAAIHWYTRALRLVDTKNNEQLQLKLTEKLYRAYEAFCNWDFEGSQLPGWFAGDQIERLELSNGLLTVRATGNTPSLELVRINLSPSRKYQFQFRLRCWAGNQAQLLWAAGTEIFTPDNLKMVAIKGNGEWEEHSIEIPPHSGGLGKFRFIPSNMPGVIELDWVRIKPAD